MSNNEEQERITSKLTKSGINTLIGPFRWLIIQCVVFFIAAGTIHDNRAWFYFIFLFIFSIIGAIIYWKVIPELANKRGEKLPGIKKWDLVLILTYFIYILIPLPLIIGFDVGRYQWSRLPISYAIVGVILYIFSFIIIEWSLIINKHFEGIVRIQKERNHQIVTSGPYKVIRHPGYLGMNLGGLAMPLILGSLYGLIFSIIPIVLIIIRTYYEDLTLQNELEGYLEYTKKVKYRLIPFLW